ncbi:MAG TPA: transglycosylase domain-containing protein [Mycobacteriales bacterium]|nr:transglycosylase domain-containing protein [Mycobacteriales bacterium]
MPISASRGRTPRRARRPVAGQIVGWTSAAALVCTLSFIAGLLLAPIDLALPPAPQSVVLLGSDNRFVASIRAPEIRSDATADDIPDVLRQAVVAAEDARFLDHNGVDVIAILRAAYRDLRAKRAEQGGSTITQQYVKNVYVGNERSALRKIREAAIAFRLEQKRSKSDILTAYLNGVFLGNGVYGVDAAARYYFGVKAIDLEVDLRTKERRPSLALARASMLAAIIPAPSARNPVRNFARAREKQGDVLNRMYVEGMITTQQASDAYREIRGPKDIVRRRDPELPTEAPEFADLVKLELEKLYGDDPEAIFRDGLKVRTTLDLTLQQAINQAARALFPDPGTPDLPRTDPGHRLGDPDTAIVAIDPRNGDLKAIYSSAFRRGGLNLATNAYRSTGSTIKPFTLVSALLAGKKTTDTYRDPGCIQLRRRSPAYPDGYRPCNYTEAGGDARGGGTKTLRRAMEKSTNTIYVKLADEIGQDKVKAAALAAGVRGAGPGQGFPVDPLKVPSMGLGGGIAISPLSLTQGFATLANHGVRLPVRTTLEIRKGGGATNTFTGELVQPESKPAGARVFPAPVADEVVDVLRGVVTRGTAVAAKLDVPVFGKTGTSDSATDAWFVGCTEDEKQPLCIGIWVGHREGFVPVRNVAGVRGGITGGAVPAKLFATIFRTAEELRAREEAEVEGASPSPTASRKPRRRSATPSPMASSAAPTVRPSAAPSAAPTTSGPGPLPTVGGSPSAEPTPEPTPEPTQASPASASPTARSRGG